MLIFPRIRPDQAHYTPNTWQYLEMPDKTRQASIICSRGHFGLLVDHTIAPDGTVTPSVVCPVEGCDFHEHIRLEGWMR